MTGRRVLFVAPSAYVLGGVQDWLDYCLPGLHERGWEPVLALTQGSFHDVRNYLERHPFDPSVAVVCRTGTTEGRVLALMETMSTVRPDVVIQVNIADCYEAIRRLKLNGSLPSVRHIVSVHGLQADMMEHLRTDSDVVDGVIASNMLAVVAARAYLADERRVQYAPYGVPVPKNGFTDRRSASVLRLVYVGRLEQDQKRVFDLSKIVRGLLNAGIETELSIAGGGPDAEQLQLAFRSDGVDHAVKQLGVLSPAELAEAYRNHDVLVICSSWETGPIVAWEAMSHGLPVLSSAYVGHLLEGALADGLNCLLYPVGDTNAAVACATRLVDPEVRAAVAEAGLALVRQRYSRSASITHWASALDSICAIAPAVPRAERHRQPCDGGRLDRFLGQHRAELVRRALFVRYQHAEPGGEWPHSYHMNVDQEAFLARASVLDRTNIQ